MANEYNIDKNAHYFACMRPIQTCFGFISFTSSTDREKWVECEIDESRYKVDNGYKVTLRSIEEGYGRENYYQSDFKSLVKSGHIIKKTSSTQHAELDKTYIPLTNNVYLVAEGWVVTD